MKSIWKVFILFLFFGMFYGCNGLTDINNTTSNVPTTSSEGQIIIHFVSNGGSAVQDIVYSITLLDLPEPSREGYDFVGWYQDSDLSAQFVIGSTALEGNITLYAKWRESNSITVVYQIYTLEDLETVRYDLDGDFTLMASVYIPGDWEPIGSKNDPFTGTFNGNGYIIEQGTHESVEYEVFGLFGYLAGEVYDLNLIHRMTADIDQKLTFGSLAGVLDGGHIHDCSIITHMNIDIRNLQTFVIFGNLVGLMDGGTIENVETETEIEFHVYNTELEGTSNQSIFIGGLVGMVDSGVIEYIETRGVLYYYEEDVPAILDCEFVTKIGGIAGEAYDANVSYVFSNYQIGGYFYNYNLSVKYYLSSVVGISNSTDFSMIDIYNGGIESDYEGNLVVYNGGVSGYMEGGSISYVSIQYFIRNFTYMDMSNGHFTVGTLVGYASYITVTDIMNSGSIQFWYVDESNAPILAGGVFGHIENSSIDRIAILAYISLNGYPITSSCLVGKIYALNDDNISIGTIYKFLDSEFLDLVFYDMWLSSEHVDDVQPGLNINGYAAFYQIAYEMFGSELWTYPEQFEPPYLKDFMPEE